MLTVGLAEVVVKLVIDVGCWVTKETGLTTKVVLTQDWNSLRPSYHNLISTVIVGAYVFIIAAIMTLLCVLVAIDLR